MWVMVVVVIFLSRSGLLLVDDKEESVAVAEVAGEDAVMCNT